MTQKYSADDYKGYEAGSDALIEKLVEDHLGWAQAIARSVARAWNLDWQIDGLDGGAYEGLLFCAGRYDAATGVPFRAYARRRIHEASTEQARQSKSWKRSVCTRSSSEQDAREVSMRLFDIYPELREGLLPTSKDEADEGLRTAIRQMLGSASMIAAFQERPENPENTIQFRQMLEIVSSLELVHQFIIWGIYWQGKSMRSIAEEWEVDELTVIREHKEIIKFVLARISGPAARNKKLKIRPGLRPIAQQLRKNKDKAPFAQFMDSSAGMLLLAAILETVIRINLT